MSSKRSKKHQSEPKVERAKTPIKDGIVEQLEEVQVINVNETSNDTAAEEANIEPVVERTIQTPEPDQMKLNPIIFNLLTKSYTGDVNENGFPHGYGEIEFDGGENFNGNFENGLMEGKGVFKWPSGVIYDGEFKNNEMTGTGTYTWPDGRCYEGNVCLGVRNGRGRLRYESKKGTCYEGDWKNGKRDGYGILTFANDGKSFYDGKWKDNKRNGHGIRMYANGDIYKGEWLNDERDGYGVMKWVEGHQTYKGEWCRGMPNGKGKYEWYVARTINSQYPLRNTYEGSFVNGMRQGYGKFVYASGASYEGEWLDDKKHGHGVLTFKNGMVHKGYFENDTIKGHPGMIGPRLTTPDIKKISSRDGQQPLSIANEPSLDIDLTELFQKENMDLTDQEKEMQAIKRMISRHISELKTIYKFYSGLGIQISSDNALVLTTMQFTRFLKDVRVHLHDISLMNCLRFMGITTTSINTKPLFLRDFFKGIVYMAYLIYPSCDQFAVISSRFQRFLEQDVLPNACLIKGTIFHREKRTNTLTGYDLVYRGIYQQIIKSSVHLSKEEEDQSTLTRRHFLLYLNSINLFREGELTVPSIVDMLTNDDDFETVEDQSCSLSFELTFLEFVEILCMCGIAYSAKKFNLHLLRDGGSSLVDSEKEQSLPVPPHTEMEVYEGHTCSEMVNGICSECNHDERISPTSAIVTKEISHMKKLNQVNSKVDNKLTEQSRSSRSREKKLDRQEKNQSNSDNSKKKDKGSAVSSIKKDTPISAVPRKQRKSVSGDVPNIIPMVTARQSLSCESTNRTSSIVSMVTEEQSIEEERQEHIIRTDLSKANDNSNEIHIEWNGTTANELNDDHWVMCINDFTKTILIPAYQLHNEIDAAMNILST